MLDRIQVTHEVEQMCCVKRGVKGEPAPIPQEGDWTKVKEIKEISGLTHGCGCCAPQQGTCKLTLNVKDGIIQEALVETLGCSGMTHSAAMAGEILPGKTILEALNTDLVCDAINVAMRELFLQIVYGRTQTAFSDNGLPVGAGLEDLGKGLRSQVGTIFSTKQKGPRYLEVAEGYVLELGLDKNDEIIGYKFVNMGKFMEAVKKGFEEFNNSGIRVFLLSYKLKENARICIIDSLEKAKEVLKKYGTVMPIIYPESFEEKDLLETTFVLCLDYKKISKDFDVIYTKDEEKNIEFYARKHFTDFFDWRKQVEEDFVPIARDIVSKEMKEIDPDYIDFFNLTISASIVPETEHEQSYILFNKEGIDESSCNCRRCNESD